MISILAFAFAAAAEPRCSVHHPAPCGGTYELVASPGFEGALRRFVGGGRATWYEPNADRARQLLDVLGGPSTGPVVVGSDLLRFDACYPHVCNIRAALFITRTGEIRGAALLYPDCSGRTCSGDEGLKATILRDPGYPDVPALARSWAEGDVASTNASLPDAREAISRVELVDIPSSMRIARRRTSRSNR